jgi:hypothetical protein
MPRNRKKVTNGTTKELAHAKRLRVPDRKSRPVRLSDVVIDALEEIRDIYQAGFCDQMDTEEVTQLSLNDVVVGLIIATINTTDTVLRTDLSSERMVSIATAKGVV